MIIVHLYTIISLRQSTLTPSIIPLPVLHIIIYFRFTPSSPFHPISSLSLVVFLSVLPLVTIYFPLLSILKSARHTPDSLLFLTIPHSPISKSIHYILLLFSPHHPPFYYSWSIFCSYHHHYSIYLIPIQHIPHSLFIPSIIFSTIQLLSTISTL